MRTTIYKLLPIIAFIVFCGLESCLQKEDPFFEKPTDLDGTIYQTLQARGNFTNYLKCLDRTPYAAGLARSGSWTVFVPDDAAFKAYLTANNYASVADIPYSVASSIIKFSIIKDAFNTTTLTYYKNQWYEGSACRRYTQLSDTITEVDSKNYPTFQNWKDRKYLIYPLGQRVKPTTYFLPAYFDAQALNPVDYSFLFPGKTYNANEMKVLDADVTEANVVTENGLIFVLNKVLDPPVNLYQNLVSDKNTGKYTIFKRMVDRFGSFSFNRIETNPITGQADSIFNLSFQTGITNNYLGFNLNDERYPPLKNNVDRTPANATGLFVPTDAALTSFINGNNIISRYFNSYDAMPLDVVGIFLNINFVEDYWDVCEANYPTNFNIGFEKLTVQSSDVVDRKFCSNGMFVGINKVLLSNSFSTVLGPLLLDSEYSIALKSLKNLQIDNSLKSAGVNYSIIGLKNSQIVDMPDPNSPYRRVTVTGYLPDLSVIYMSVTGDPTPANNRTYPDPAASTPSSSDISYVTTTLNSIILNQIVEKAIDPVSDNFYQTKSGEFIKVTNGVNFAGGGNIAASTTAHVDSKIETTNGTFYYMDGPIIRPTQYTYGALSANSTLFSKFIQVLNSSNVVVDILGSTDKLIGFLDLRKSYTLLAPNNSAVQKAIDDHVIPDPATVNSISDPVVKATAQLALQNFAKKHFIQRAIVTDGNNSGKYSSLYIDKIVDFIPIYKEFTFQNNYSPMSLDIKDATTGALIAKTGSKINILSKMVVVHEIDSYLK